MPEIAGVHLGESGLYPTPSECFNEQRLDNCRVLPSRSRMGYFLTDRVQTCPNVLCVALDVTLTTPLSKGQWSLISNFIRRVRRRYLPTEVAEIDKVNTRERITYPTSRDWLRVQRVTSFRGRRMAGRWGSGIEHDGWSEHCRFLRSSSFGFKKKLIDIIVFMFAIILLRRLCLRLGAH